MGNWYYAVGSETRGPVAEEEITRLARDGTLTTTSYVVREGESTWQSLSDVEAMLGLQRNTAGTYATAPPTADASAVQTGWAAPGSGGPASFGAPAPDTTGQTGWGAPQQQPSGQPGWGAPPGASSPGWGPPSGQNPWTAPSPTAWPSDYGQPATGHAVAGTGPGGAAYAEWWQRLLAKLIDFVVLLIPAVLLFVAVAWDELQDRFDADNDSFQFTLGGRALLSQLLSGLIGLAYYAILNGRGQTLGKMALGIKVVGVNDGQPIGIGKGALRHILQFVAGFVSCIGAIFVLLDALWPLWDGRKQAIHDKLGGSAVVRAR